MGTIESPTRSQLAPMGQLLGHHRLVVGYIWCSLILYRASSLACEAILETRVGIVFGYENEKLRVGLQNRTTITNNQETFGAFIHTKQITARCGLFAFPTSATAINR
jgi:hypothetical protein